MGTYNQPDDLEYEILKLIVAVKNYRDTKKNEYFVERQIDVVMAILADRPGMINLMRQLGLLAYSNHDR